MADGQGRTVLAGAVVAVSAGALTLVGSTLGVAEVWPVLVVAGAGLLVGVPRLRHALALASGVLIGSLTVWAGTALLPPVPAGRAGATAVGVLLLTVVTLGTRGRLRLSMQLVGFAATVASTGPAAARVPPGGAALLTVIATSAVALLVAAGLGLLIAQVAQLVASGTANRLGGGTATVTAIVAAAVLLPAPNAAGADVAARGVIEHRQTVVRSHLSDGTVTGGSVITQLSASGTGDVTVVLRDQAIRGLRSLTGLAGPDVAGRDVTHRLEDGSRIRTVAALDRSVPVDLEVAVTLDGEPTTPAAVVGRSGRMSVTYTLTNRTAEQREIRLIDGGGRPRSVTRDVAVPFVGELVVALDDRFRAIRSEEATVGDGVLRAPLFLAGPIGAPVRTVTWSADVESAVIPPLQVRLTPTVVADTARGGLDVAHLRRSTDALRELSDAAGLARTGATAALSFSRMTASGVDDDLAASTVAILERLLADAAVVGAELDESRALIETQDARVRDGDGQVHPLLAREDVRREPGVSGTAGGTEGAPRVSSSVVYVLDVAGRGEESVPGPVVRLLLALALLIAVGLLGRAVGRLTGTGDA